MAPVTRSAKKEMGNKKKIAQKKRSVKTKVPISNKKAAKCTPGKSYDMDEYIGVVRNKPLTKGGAGRSCPLPGKVKSTPGKQFDMDAIEEEWPCVQRISGVKRACPVKVNCNPGKQFDMDEDD